MSDKIRMVSTVVLVLLLLGFSSREEKISGTYFYGNGYDSHEVKIRNNHTFRKLESGCTYGFDSRGKWLVNNDTLSLIWSCYRRPGGKRSDFKPARGTIDLYLIRKDMLIDLDRRDSGGYYQDDTLRRE